MLGLAFTGFASMLDEEYSFDFTEDVLSAVPTSTGGAYTAFGSYPSFEMKALINELAERTGRTHSELYLDLGRFIVSNLAGRYSHHFKSSSEPFAFLCATQNRLQHEARKLFRDEDLPVFQASHIDAQTLQIDCDMEPEFSGILLGGVLGVLEYYEADVDVENSPILKGGTQWQRFVLRRRQAQAA
ncbi:MAG: hypothetical protein CME88_06190 [Hirschia sp.]|nr:hypothetical protein [Hirschia sp.]MBF17949.1 hypothetical protein [Hirschia sp.]|tara:strand:+ start:101 stop:658 length:558 start_codon:yes stop_codon:yes gene_type:complete